MSSAAKALGFLERLAGYLYRKGLRPCLPRLRTVYKADIPSCLDHRLGDDCVPARWVPTRANHHDDPLYEYGLVSGLKAYVNKGDTVITVGGGLGITTSIAGILVGPKGCVLCYEGAPWNVACVRETARRNKVSDNVSVTHAVVGANLGVYTPTHGCITVPPSDLPECDVLELDCEGAEQLILRNITIRPRVILVETHGMLGSSSSECTLLLESIGYHVSSLGVAEPRWREGCVANDIMVLVGIRKT